MRAKRAIGNHQLIIWCAPNKQSVSTNSTIACGKIFVVVGAAYIIKRLRQQRESAKFISIGAFALLGRIRPLPKYPGRCPGLKAYWPFRPLAPLQPREGANAATRWSKSLFRRKRKAVSLTAKGRNTKSYLFIFFDFNITISHSLIVRELWCDIVILKCRFLEKKEHFLFLCVEKITAPQRKNISCAEEKV